MGALSCTKCGRCCQYVFITINPDLIAPDMIKYWRLRGVVGRTRLEVFLPCKWFNPATKRCIFYRNRPEFCKKYYCEKVT